MASLTLMVIGSAVAGPIGGAIGAYAGSYIDQQYIFPALFGEDQNKIQGFRIKELQIQGATEGEPIKKMWGRENVIAGQIIYISDLIETKTTKKSGGGGKGGPPTDETEVTTFTYSVNVGIAWCQGELTTDGITEIFANEKTIFVLGSEDARYTSITHYMGSATQAVDPIIDADVSGGTPAFRGVAWTMIEGLDLSDFGNFLPQFQARVQAHEQLLVQDAIDEMTLEAGMLAADVDTDFVDGCLRGYGRNGPNQMMATLEPIMLHHQIDQQDKDGKLTFFSREFQTVVVVDPADLGVHESGSEVPKRLEISNVDTRNLPDLLTLTAMDPLNRNEPLSVTERVDVFTTLEHSRVTLPFPMSTAETRANASRILWNAHGERESATFFLGPKYINLREQDVAQITELGETYSIRINRVVRGANFLMEFEGTLQETQTIDGDYDDIEDTLPPPVYPYQPPAMTSLLINLPALLTYQVDLPGLFWTAYTTDEGGEFRGAQLYSSPDDVTYTRRSITTEQGVVGVLTATLQSVGSEHRFFTNTNDADGYLLSLDTKGPDMLFETKTLKEIRNGANYIAIGTPGSNDWEIMAFVTATQVSSFSWTLNDLLRGQFGTPIRQHIALETVVLLDSDAVYFLIDDHTNLGLAYYWKVVASGGSVSGATAITRPIDPDTLIPFPPTHLHRIDDDYTVRWSRRTRKSYRTFSGKSMDPDMIAGEMELLKQSDSTVYATYAATEVDGSSGKREEVVIPSADFTGAGYSTGNTIKVNVYQRTNQGGRSAVLQNLVLEMTR